MPEIADYDIIAFESAAKWRQWLANRGATTSGVWLRLYKKASGIASITYGEALDEALCFGWIDGLKRSYDEVSYLQKFTPRRKKSLWSKQNREHIARLIETKRMMPAGLAEVEQAKADGRWDAAYDQPSKMTIPEDFLAVLRANPKAAAFFETLNKTNTYAIAWRLRTAKTDETRKRRQAAILALLEKGEKLH